jgi:hypothetical protein
MYIRKKVLHPLLAVNFEISEKLTYFYVYMNCDTVGNGSQPSLNSQDNANCAAKGAAFLLFLFLIYRAYRPWVPIEPDHGLVAS